MHDLRLGLAQNVCFAQIKLVQILGLGRQGWICLDQAGARFGLGVAWGL